MQDMLLSIGYLVIMIGAICYGCVWAYYRFHPDGRKPYPATARLVRRLCVVAAFSAILPVSLPFAGDAPALEFWISCAGMLFAPCLVLTLMVLRYWIHQQSLDHLSLLTYAMTHMPIANNKAAVFSANMSIAILMSQPYGGHYYILIAATVAGTAYGMHCVSRYVDEIFGNVHVSSRVAI